MAYLDDLGCTPRHLETLSDFLKTCDSKVGSGKVPPRTTTTSTTILSSNKTFNAVTPYQTRAL
jgi:hypothetical protein